MSFEEGMRLFRSGDIPGACEQFHQAVEQDENNHKAWNALGICLSKEGEHDDADTCFENALMLDPGNSTYEKNREKNDQKKTPKKQEPKKTRSSNPVQTTDKHSVVNEYDEPLGDRFSNKLAIIIAVLGFIFGIGFAFLVMVVGGLGAVFGTSGAESLIVRGWTVIFLSFVGVIASVVRHKQYGAVILILSGIFIIILISAGGIIPGALFIIAGYLIFREINFNLRYFIDFKNDTLKKALYSFILLICLVSFVSALSTVESSNPSKTAVSQNSDLGSSSSHEVDILPSPDKSPTLEKYSIYAVQPTNSKGGTLIWDYDPSTDEYLYQFVIYQSSNGGYQADKSKASWGKRWLIEGMCKTKVGGIDPNRPFEKYGYTFYPET